MKHRIRNKNYDNPICGTKYTVLKKARYLKNTYNKYYIKMGKNWNYNQSTTIYIYIIKDLIFHSCFLAIE